MTEKVENLILERLRRIDEKLDTISAQVRENRDRLGHLEQLYVSLSHRVDRIDDRIARIESRLDLQEAR